MMEETGEGLMLRVVESGAESESTSEVIPGVLKMILFF
jgi:hypothetical protein